MTLIPECSYKQALFMLVLAIVLAGCSMRQVRVDGSWEEGVSQDQAFARVLVVGLSPSASARCDFESFMATQIRATGAEAKASCNLMRTSDPVTRESIEAVVAEYGADAVLTTVLVQADLGVQAGGDRETRGGGYYKPTDIGYAGYYYGGYGAYGVPVVYGDFRTAPVITTLDGEVSILSMLYATSDATLVYQLKTTASDLRSRDNSLATITPPIAERLQQDGLLRSNSSGP
jgi:hypothetical protein